jgi:hypothetical protein
VNIQLGVLLQGRSRGYYGMPHTSTGGVPPEAGWIAVILLLAILAFVWWAVKRRSRKR